MQKWQRTALTLRQKNTKIEISEITDLQIMNTWKLETRMTIFLVFLPSFIQDYLLLGPPAAPRDSVGAGLK